MNFGRVDMIHDLILFIQKQKREWEFTYNNTLHGEKITESEKEYMDKKLLEFFLSYFSSKNKVDEAEFVAKHISERLVKAKILTCKKYIGNDNKRKEAELEEITKLVEDYFTTPNNEEARKDYVSRKCILKTDQKCHQISGKELYPNGFIGYFCAKLMDSLFVQDSGFSDKIRKELIEEHKIFRHQIRKLLNKLDDSTEFKTKQPIFQTEEEKKVAFFNMIQDNNNNNDEKQILKKNGKKRKRTDGEAKKKRKKKSEIDQSILNQRSNVSKKLGQFLNLFLGINTNHNPDLRLVLTSKNLLKLTDTKEFQKEFLKTFKEEYKDSDIMMKDFELTATKLIKKISTNIQLKEYLQKRKQKILKTRPLTVFSTMVD